jgi:hypothetical protein
MRLIASLKNLKSSDKGSFTIEASLVFPIILMLTIFMQFFSVYVYQKVILYNQASFIAQRAAHSWDNSYKDPVTGGFKDGKVQYDGLYWRITSDNMFDFMGLITGESPGEVTVKFETDDNKNLKRPDPNFKLNNAFKSRFEKVGENLDGQITYTNNLIDRKITVTLNNPIQLPFWGNRLMSATVTTRVTDPAEFMRTFNLIRTYSTLINKNKKTVEKVDFKSFQ